MGVRRTQLSHGTVRYWDSGRCPKRPTMHEPRASSELETAVTASSHQQALVLEQASARLTALAGVIGDSRAQVELGVQLAREAAVQCDAGNGAVTALEEGLSALAELVGGLPDIVERMRQVRLQCHEIDKLAFHSHLLALNASVEAARLGDRGGAFGVVADGIRELASASRHAAERIHGAVAHGTQAIETIQSSAADTLVQNQAAGKRCTHALSHIADAVQRIGAANVKLTEDAARQEAEARAVDQHLRSQVEDNSRRTSEIIGLLTGRTIEDVDPQHCHDRLEEYVLIDVRRREEFHDALGHVPRATLITLDDGFEARLSEYPKDRPYLFICRSGGRSARAARIAQQAGFSSIYNLRGGMLRWNELGYHTIRGAA